MPVFWATPVWPHRPYFSWNDGPKCRLSLWDSPDTECRRADTTFAKIGPLIFPGGRDSDLC
jgi:hypothetical protein